MQAYPAGEVPFGPPEAALCGLLLAGAAVPFAGRAAR